MYKYFSIPAASYRESGSYQAFKTNINAVDGGEALRVQAITANDMYSIDYCTGSLASHGPTANKIAQYLQWMSSSTSPFKECTEQEFNSYYSESLSFIGSKHQL
jgi:hypothetical protein